MEIQVSFNSLSVAFGTKNDMHDLIESGEESNNLPSLPI
jgi:hypothetical protein